MEEKKWRDKESRDNEKKFRKDPDSKYRERDGHRDKDPRQLYKLLVVLRAKQMTRQDQYVEPHSFSGC